MTCLCVCYIACWVTMLDVEHRRRLRSVKRLPPIKRVRVTEMGDEGNDAEVLQKFANHEFMCSSYIDKYHHLYQ